LTILGNWQTRITNRDLEKQSEVALQGVFMQSMMVDGINRSGKRILTASPKNTRLHATWWI
jgi:hypothetical protein